MSDFDVSDAFLKRVAKMFKGFAQETRLKILRELHSEPRNVTQLQEAIGTSQANVSKHLGVLREQGIVESEMEGNEKMYQIASEDVKMICEFVCGCLKKQLEEEAARLEKDL